MCKYFIGFYLFLLPSIFFAQNNKGTLAVIENIIIEGNRKTKERIILRELDFTVGDTVSVVDFQERMALSKKRLYNTGLFNLININFNEFSLNKATLKVHIKLVENLYIYPAPIFELADRNFNVWWEEMNRSFSRVNYGVRIDHFNTTGVKDRLKLKIQRGYTRKYELVYEYPYLNDKIGLGAHIFFAEQKEIGYKTEGNKTLFFTASDERILLKRFRTGVEYKYRPNLFLFQTARLEFHRNSIDEEVAQDLNPDYFLNGDRKLRFFMFEYDFNFNKRIFSIYPEGGFAINANLKKEGFGLFKEFNNLSVHLDIDKHQTIARNLVTSFRIKGKTNLIRNELAFANNTGMGYFGNIIGGYELYVIDGSDFVFGETQLKFKVLDKMFNLGKTMPINGFKKLNLQVFLRANFDYGYVNERKYVSTNTLNNDWIVGYGPALDILMFHNFLFQIEYSFNQLGESGLYLHTTNGF